MKNMRSKIVIGALAVSLLAVSITGCSGNEEAKAVESTQADALEEDVQEDKTEEVSETQTNLSSEESNQAVGDESATELDEDTSKDVLSEEAPSEGAVTNLQMVSEFYQDHYFADEEPYTEYAYTVTDCPALSDEEAMKYPKLNETMEQVFKGRINSALDIYHQISEGAESDYKDIGEEYFSTNFCERRTQVMRADSSVVSLLHVDSDYYGGNHPNTVYHTCVIDSETGEIVGIEDIVKDMDMLEKYLIDELKDKFSNVAFYDLENDIHKYCSTSTESLQFTVDHGFVTFYFSPYDIAPFAEGMQWINIGFDEVDGLLTDKYKDYPEDYAVTFLPFSSAYVNLSDKVRQLHFVTSKVNPDEDYSEIRYSVYYSGSSYEDDSSFYYEAEPVYIRRAGNDYLYVIKHGDNDYTSIDVLKLTENSIEKIAEEYLGIASQECNNHYYDDCWRNSILTDPNDFKTGSSIQSISTLYMTANSRVNEDGTIEQLGDYCDVDSQLKLTLLQDISFDEVDANSGEKIGTKNLKKGDCITIKRVYSDEKTYCTTEDNSAIMVEVVNRDGEKTVNGILLEELFDGLVFAG